MVSLYLVSAWNALGKARSVAIRRPGAVVIGADTVVVQDGDLLGKPADAAAAASMLERLSGASHTVLTAVALVSRAAGTQERALSAIGCTVLRTAIRPSRSDRNTQHVV